MEGRILLLVFDDFVIDIIFSVVEASFDFIVNFIVDVWRDLRSTNR